MGKIINLNKDLIEKMSPIICYLNLYGQTREDDLIRFASTQLTPKEARKLVKEMHAWGFIEGITHDLLKSKTTYVKVGSLAPEELYSGMSRILEIHQIGQVTRKEVKVILDQAAVAGKFGEK